MLFYVWKDIYIQQFNIPAGVTILLIILMALKFIFDVTMVTLFIYLVSFFAKQRAQQKIIERLNEAAKNKLRREGMVTTVFIVFYIVRVILMDLGYAVLVGMYFVDQDFEDILEGDKSYIFIALYTLDFLICLTLLTLFYLYSKKSSDDEARLKQLYFISMRDSNDEL